MEKIEKFLLIAQYISMVVVAVLFGVLGVVSWGAGYPIVGAVGFMLSGVLGYYSYRDIKKAMDK